MRGKKKKYKKVEYHYWLIGIDLIDETTVIFQGK